ncbi:MAG: class I SAM-dependent methyltransferase [Polyangiales bacterium]
MALGRRKVRLDDRDAWVFNRMAASYGARPAYPVALIDALAALAGAPGACVVDVGAGIGHVALPLAARGYPVIAVEPAEAMLALLRDEAAARDLPVRALHGAAEALPVATSCAALGVIADALHFLDAERAGQELRRALAPGGALALVSCELAPTPFMTALTCLMEEAAPRRPRDVGGARVQLAALAGVTLAAPVEIDDEVPVEPPTLERILQSISFIGPAMNPSRAAAFRARVHALPGPPAWARRFRLWAGRRSR